MTLQYEGRASEVPDAELQLIKDTYFAQVPNAAKFEADPRTRWFVVRPTLIRYRDYRISTDGIAELVIDSFG